MFKFSLIDEYDRMFGDKFKLKIKIADSSLIESKYEEFKVSKAINICLLFLTWINNLYS